MDNREMENEVDWLKAIEWGRDDVEDTVSA